MQSLAEWLPPYHLAQLALHVAGVKPAEVLVHVLVLAGFGAAFSLLARPAANHDAALCELLTHLLLATTQEGLLCYNVKWKTPAGKELGVAKATSCVVPRGKFDLVLRDGTPHTLCGTAAAQRWQLSMDDIVQLVTVPKGDSVKPMVLGGAQVEK